MGLRLKNLKLDKDKYIYGIDKDINLSFDLESEKNTNIDKISILYGYDFFGEKQKHKAYKNEIVEKNKNISDGMSEKFSFIIPIKFFNFENCDGVNHMRIENYINIEIKNGFLNKTIKEKISPNIIIDPKSYDLKNLTLGESIDFEKYEEEEEEDNNDDNIDSLKYEKSEDDINKIENDNSINPNLDYLNKKIKIAEDIEYNESEFVIIKRHFEGHFTGKITSFFEKQSITADYIHKDIFNKLKKDVFIRIFDKLVKSKFYNFIYKHIYILPILFYFNSDTNIFTSSENLFIQIPSQYFIYYLILFFFFPIFLISFSKVSEQIFSYKLKKKIYEFSLLENKKIENNLRNKLLKGSLEINDIFKKLDLKIYENYIDYNLYVSLDLNVGTYNGSASSDSTNYHNHIVYTLDLFNYTGKGYFDLNKVKLLENNYEKLLSILPKSNKNKATKVFYTLNYKFDSTYLPNIEGKVDFDLNIDSDNLLDVKGKFD